MRFAARRSGIPRSMRFQLKEAHRACVMLKHGAYLFDDTGREQWQGLCLRCGKMTWLQVSHIEPKGQYRHMEFDVENAFALCYVCHLHWWHKNPREADAFAIQQLGAARRERLAIRARTRPGKMDPVATLMYLKKLRRELEGKSREEAQA